MSWTASYAQTGKQIQDTVKCYGITELQYIASSLIEAKACDTLLMLSEMKIANRDSAIGNLKQQIGYIQEQSNLKSEIINEDEEYIMQLEQDVENEQRKKKWLKFGWSSSSVVLGVLLFLSLI